MNTTAKKQLVAQFFRDFSDGRIDQAFALVDENATWWVPGNLPFSGTKSKAEYLQIANRISNGFPSGLRLDPVNMIEEGDQVAAEVESHGTHVNGRAYNNKYHFLFRIENGHFAGVKEYMDTLHLAQLIAP